MITRWRQLLAGGTVAALTAATLAAGATPAAAQTVDGPPTVTADDVTFTPQTLLHNKSVRQADLLPGPVHELQQSLAGYLEPSPDHPQYAGAVGVIARNGVVVSRPAVGYALRYAGYDADTGEATELPRDQWIPARQNTMFDLASMSKLFTSIVAVKLMQQHKIDLNATVASYIPEFAQQGKGTITIRNLLTHTSGMRPDPDPSLCDYDTNAERWAAVYATKPQAPPDTEYIYSDLNLLTLQKVIETVTGRTLDQEVAQKITGPLGLQDTMYNPPASLKHRIAATEDQPWTGRGIVQGTVHDENAYCLGGVAGHAGVFSTTGDLSVLAQMIINGGRYGSARILSPASTRLLFTNFNQAFPGDDHGLGFELNQLWYMDALSSPVSMGHTGYTGPSIVIDPLSHSFAILLANRVHPTRDWGTNNPSRRAIAAALGRALPVRPEAGCTGWYSGTGDDRTADLGLPLQVGDQQVGDQQGGDQGATLNFGLWYDTENTDLGSLQATTDGTTWQNVPLDLRAGQYHWSADGTFSGFAGRRWAQASATLPAGVTRLRWRYDTDALYQGRGVFVDCVRATAPDGSTIFDSSRPADATAFVPDGWVSVTSDGTPRGQG